VNLRRLAPVLALSLLASTVSAQLPPLPPSGHPPVMPPGHGSLGAGQHQTAPDRVEPAADLPTGTIVAMILDAEDRPLPGTDVRLGILYETIAEGQTKSEKFAKTGSDGVVRFDQLPTGSSNSYRLTVKSGPGEFGSSPFNLKETGGMRVSLHVFPVVENLTTAAVGMRGFFYIETRDDVFQVEAMFRVINLGRTAWVPREVIAGLPAGFKAFNGGESMDGSRWEAVEGRGARLIGTFPPGQRDLNFRFQVPKEPSTTAMFRFTPPPRSAEIRVIAIASQNMRLEVEGFEAPQDAIGPSGDRVLVTRKLAGRGTSEFAPFLVTLTGLPVPGPGRWVAVLIALGFVAAGAAAVFGKWKSLSGERVETDRARACDLLLSELVALTEAKQRGEIGPQTHERTHRALIDALTRIGLPSEPRPRKRAQKAQRA
jgi:hypothetical protein